MALCRAYSLRLFVGVLLLSVIRHCRFERYWQCGGKWVLCEP